MTENEAWSGGIRPHGPPFAQITVENFGSLQRFDDGTVGYHAHVSATDGSPSVAATTTVAVVTSWTAAIALACRILQEARKDAHTRRIISEEPFGKEIFETLSNDSQSESDNEPRYRDIDPFDDDLNLKRMPRSRHDSKQVLLPIWMAWVATAGATLCAIALVLRFIWPRALFSGAAAIGIVSVTLVMIAGNRCLRDPPSKTRDHDRPRSPSAVLSDHDQ